MLVIFSIVPMFGLVMAFQRYEPITGIFGSEFVGLINFKKILMFPDSREVIANTLIIAVLKIFFHILVPVSFALLLNECRISFFKRSVQTIVYLPNYLSWVIVAVIMNNFLSDSGVVNTILMSLGMKQSILFLASNTWFRKIVIISDTWKTFGYGSIVYLAAITNIDLTFYEAADMDGASRLQKVLYITLPGIASTVVLMATLSLGNILNAGFDQIFNLYSPLVYKTGDVIDTYVYRMGLVNLQYSYGTAVGFFKSVVSFILIIVSYKLADRFAGYRIF